MHSREIGLNYEKQAQKFLKKNRVTILQTNYYCRFGELDIIGLTDALLFIEVRYRQNSNFGTPEETVSPAKQKKLVKTAQFFLAQNPRYQHHDMRFDLIAISGTDAGEITWYKNIIDVVAL